MKVKGLIVRLMSFGPDEDVHIAYCNGDYWQTIVAPEVRRVERHNVLLWHGERAPRLVDEERLEEDERGLCRDVVVIR